jgi:hypothetical protein
MPPPARSNPLICVKTAVFGDGDVAPDPVGTGYVKPTLGPMLPLNVSAVSAVLLLTEGPVGKPTGPEADTLVLNVTGLLRLICVL